MTTEIEMARHLTYHALWLFSQGRDAVREVSMAKIAATEAATKVADQAVQIHGGYGYIMEFPVQRARRDARLGPIGGGAPPIMPQSLPHALDPQPPPGRSP